MQKYRWGILRTSEGFSQENIDELLEIYQKEYKRNVEKWGQEEISTIRSGVNLANALKKARRGIESERLLTKLVAISKRVHGPDHPITKSAKSNLQQFKVRYVRIQSRNEKEIFQALRYEEGGGKCVVQGPIADPRNIQDEVTFAVDNTADLGFGLGSPVICHGLKKATHLNGKIGEIRSYDEDNECFKVHFEGGGLEPMRAKFLRIVFELPEVP